MRISARVFVTAVVAACLPIMPAVPAWADGPALQPFVPDVQTQFDALALRPDGLGFDPGASPDATICKHYQGIARTQGPDGTPYLFVTRAGVANICGGSDDPGNLLVIRMGSRDKNGERLRSNRLRTNWPIDDPDWATPSDPRDRVVNTITFRGGDKWPTKGSTVGWPAYGHPGSMQLVGDVLAIAMELPYEGADPATIAFLDVSDPGTPRFLSHYELSPDAPTGIFGAGTVGVTPVKAPSGECCQYLMAVAGRLNQDLRFYRSKATGEGNVTDLRSSALDWEPVGRYTETQLEADGCLGAADWPSGEGSGHQSFSFVRQGNLDGPLFLLGASNSDPSPLGDDLLDLYEVGLTETCPFVTADRHHVTRDAYGGIDNSANFAAGSGAYVSPSGELILYATKHANNGPLRLNPDGTAGDRRIAEFAEYRHRDIVRPGSPTLRPGTKVDGPFEVDEGSSVNLIGSGEQAITKAWIQLFEDDGLDQVLPGTSDFESNWWLAIDYPDRDADDWDDLEALDHDDAFGFDLDFEQNAESWRWFAPAGCTISANDFPTRSDDFPGPDTKLLAGTGDVREVTDLDSIGFDNTLEGVTFFHKNTQGLLDHDCDRYYQAPIGLGWDLDGDDSFETSGTSAPFSAASLDGPATATVSARATHPTDATPLGIGVPVAVPVSVRNVAPNVDSAGLTDSLGNDVGVGGTPALAGLPVSLDVTFSDPGLADTQTASIDWGDGTPADTAFASFSDAHSGALGRLQDRHAFAVPGTYTVVATITDDDGGATSTTASVEVVTPAVLIEHLADELTSMIGSAANGNVAAAQRSARDQLIGNHGGKPPTNGAVDKLDADDPVGAITKISAAISYLATAEASGAGDLTSMKDLLGLVAEAIATAAHADARAAVGPPSPGEARSLATIADLIELGHRQLGDGRYSSACDSFKQASAKATKLAG